MSNAPPTSSSGGATSGGSEPRARGPPAAGRAPRAPGAPEGFKAEIAALRAALARKEGQVKDLITTNTALRVRGAALHVMIRVLDEMRRHKQALAALGGGEGAADDVRLAASLRALGADQQAAELMAGAVAGDLLAALPHLGRGTSLTHLEGVSADDVSRVKQIDIPQAQRLWKGLVEEALLQQVGADEAAACGGGGGGGGWHEVGVRMSKFHSLLSVWNWLLYQQFHCYNFVTGAPATALGDAPLSHWETVIKAARLTRLQALIIIDIYDTFLKRAAALRQERADLSAELLRSAAGGAAAAAAGPEAAAALVAAAAAVLEGDGGGAGMAQQVAVFDRLQETVDLEKGVTLLTALSIIGVCTPEQWARLSSGCFPWPVNTASCCSVLKHALRFEPDYFVEH